MSDIETLRETLRTINSDLTTCVSSIAALNDKEHYLYVSNPLIRQYLEVKDEAAAFSKIVANVFKSPSALISLDIPEGVTAIPYRFFFDTTAQYITFPSTLKKIGEGAFHCDENRKYTSIALPEGLEVIEPQAFCYSKLKTIVFPNSLTDLAGFNRTFELTGIKLGTGIKRIGTYAFHSSGLTTIDGGLPEGLEEIGSWAFANCSITIPTLPSTLTKIDSNAFSHCAETNTVTIPGSVKSIGENAFNGTKIRTLILEEGVERIEQSAFSSCSLATVQLPSTLTLIGSYALSYMNCTSIILPASLSYIGSNAFYTTGITRVIYVTIDKTMAEVQAMSNFPWGLISSCQITCSDGVFRVGDV